MAAVNKKIRYDTVDVGIIKADNTSVYPNLDAQWGPWDSTAEYLAWMRGKDMLNDPDFVPQSGQKIGITQVDGTVKELIWQQPYSGEGYWDDGTYDERSITGAIYFNSVAALKAATNLSAGDIVITKGYYSANDGGGSTFRIISSSSYAGTNWKQVISNESIPYLDDATLIQLQNGLYADILVPSNMEVSFLQMGARKMSISWRVISSVKYYYISQPDNKPYMMKWLAFNDRRKTTYSLFIPAGIYSFSETWLLRSEGNACALGIRIRGELMQNSGGSGSIFIPHYTSQKYIIRVGHKTRDDGTYASSRDSDWIPMRGTVIRDITFGTTRYAWQGNGITYQGLNVGTGSNWTLDPNDDATTSSNYYRYVTKGALWLDSCPYGQFDGLYFSCVAGSSMYLTQCYESHFGYTNIRNCGRVAESGYVYPMVYINAPGPSDVSACYFYYFNFEKCYGNFFYSHTQNFSHNEFNNIQIEGAVEISTSSTVIGEISKDANVVPYDTDSNYTTPSVGSGKVFGKWIKWFVFTGNIGLIQNYVNSISASNFGNGFKRYRTYRLSNGNVIDMDGNVQSSYSLENGIYYAVDAGGNKIVDYYRHYALFGQDENSSQNFTSFAWNIGTVYLYRQGDTDYPGLRKYSGPWVVYLRNAANTHTLTVNHTFDRGEYPYFFRSTRKGAFSLDGCNTPGAIPFMNMLGRTGGNEFLATRSGTISPNGLCVRPTSVNAFSFIAMPGVSYSIRAYCTQSVYDTLLQNSSQGGKPLFKWKGLLCIGDTSTPYTETSNVVINSTGWITIPMPDLGLTEATRVYFYLASGGGGNAHSNTFLRGLYLDVLVGR